MSYPKAIIDVMKDTPFVYALTTIQTGVKKYTKKFQSEEIVEYTSESMRTVAISDDLEHLKALAERNACDIHEGCYNYVLIEQVYFGLYTPSIKVAWYEWIPKEGGDKYEGKYEPCEEPSQFNNTVNFAIG